MLQDPGILRFFYKSQNFPEFCKFPSQPKFFTLRSSVFLRVGILECSKNNFRTLGQVAHMETTITVTIRPMMISPVLKNPLANSSNLVIIYPIAIYTLQIMVMVQHHHQRTHQVVDHVTLILRTIPIPIIMVALNREWFEIQIKIRVNHHHLQHNLPPKIHSISHQMQNLVEVKIFNIRINATPIRNRFNFFYRKVSPHQFCQCIFGVL